MDLIEIVKEIEKCGFECEAGPITNNLAFIELKNIARQTEELLTPMQPFIRIGDDNCTRAYCPNCENALVSIAYSESGDNFSGKLEQYCACCGQALAF